MVQIHLTKTNGDIVTACESPRKVISRATPEQKTSYRSPVGKVPNRRFCSGKIFFTSVAAGRYGRRSRAIFLTTIAAFLRSSVKLLKAFGTSVEMTFARTPS
jgi:hypothetical protein